MRTRQILTALGLTVAMTVAAQNSVSLNQDGKRTVYNPMIFGQFIEHFDNQVYGGIYDPGNPLSDEDGFRTDVIEALKEIKTPIVRWPGGCFVSTYHWVDGIGKERVPVYDKTWQAEDPNTFGTDEYIKWCRKVGCEPYICTNAGTGTAEEMSNWMEYCNLDHEGRYAKKRIANGSGTSVVDVNRLIKQFDAMQQMTKQLSGKNMKKLQKKMGRMGGGFPGMGGGFPGF